MGHTLKRRRLGEKAIEVLLFICASVAVITIILMTILIFKEGLPIFSSYGFTNFIFGTTWTPTTSDPQFGILPMIVTSFIVTVLSIVFAVPLAIGCAIFLSEFAKGKWVIVLRRAIELLAGIPSVIFGYFALVTIVPLIRQIFGVQGLSILAGGIILSIMILPTIITISETALKAVPQDYKDASYALGATHWQTIYKVLVPAAKSGIITGIVLGIGRAVGETMAVMLVMGNIPVIRTNILEPARTLTVNVIMDMSYATPGGQIYSALFGTAIVLFVFIMLLNLTIQYISHKAVKRNG